MLACAIRREDKSIEASGKEKPETLSRRFMFELTKEESQSLRLQNVTLKRVAFKVS
jgi:hypothetical protein